MSIAATPIGRRQALGWLSSASVLALTPGLAFAKTARALYQDARAPIADRVKDLLGRMTLEEKVAQMIALWATKADVMEGLAFDPTKASTASASRAALFEFLRGFVPKIPPTITFCRAVSPSKGRTI